METTNWLRSNKDVLSLNSIENKYGIPQGTLSKCVRGNRELPKKWVHVIESLRLSLTVTDFD